MSKIFVRICAVLIAFRSLTNFNKLRDGDDAVLVFFGQILRGNEVIIPALAVGLFMLITGVALWKPARWALPLIAVYALYVVVNLFAWTFGNPDELVRVGARVSSATNPDTLRWFGALLMAAYSGVAIGTTVGPAWIVYKQRAAEG